MAVDDGGAGGLDEPMGEGGGGPEVLLEGEAFVLVHEEVALVAPRGAALAFAGAGGIAILLATTSRWEERLEWWGVTAAARQWENPALWTAIAFGLALLSLLAGWSRPRPRDFTSV